MSSSYDLSQLFVSDVSMMCLHFIEEHQSKESREQVSPGVIREITCLHDEQLSVSVRARAAY